MEPTEAIIHTVMESEKEAFTNHVNETLRGDLDVQKRLPIKPADIFDAVEDGIIFCKLINAAVPGKVPPIAPEAININATNVYQKIENLVLAIQSSKAIGCIVVNVNPQFIFQKRPHIILGMIWQIIKIHIANSITIKFYPQIELLREEGEPEDIMQKLGYEEILKRWLNYHIKKNKGDRKIKNFGKDMADGYAYGNVFQNISESFNKDYWNMNQNQKAEQTINECKKQKISTSVKAEGITNANPRLNIILCAAIFNHKHGLTYQQKKVAEPVILPPEPETDETREIRVFKNWINSQGLQDVYVNQLIDDLKTGHVLLKVIERLRPKSVDWERYSQKTNSRIHIIQNCNYALELCQSFAMKLVGIGGLDIVDGKTSLALGVVWQLCKLYWDERVGIINEEKLVEWANSKVPVENRIKNIKDKSLRNCFFLLNLIQSVKPKSVDFTKVQQGDHEDAVISRINYTISVGRKIGCQIITLWEHINECNVRYVTLLLAELHRLAGSKRD